MNVADNQYHLNATFTDAHPSLERQELSSLLFTAHNQREQSVKEIVTG